MVKKMDVNRGYPPPPPPPTHTQTDTQTQTPVVKSTVEVSRGKSLKYV